MPPASSPVMVRCDLHPGQMACPCNTQSHRPHRNSSSPSTHLPHSNTVLSTSPPNGSAHIPAHGGGLLAYSRTAIPGLPGGLPPTNTGGAPGESVYSSPYAAVAAAAAAHAYGPLAADPAALYSGLVGSKSIIQIEL